MLKPRPYLQIFWVVAVAGLAAIGLFNYWTEHSNIFKSGIYERRLMDLLAAGWNVAPVHSPRGFDDRLLQQYFIERMTQSPEVVVLGSSRTMQARSNLFPGRTFHNHAVQGACLEDELAFLQMYRLRGFRPSIIVLTVDPWLFNADNALIAWKSIDTYYYDYAREKKLRWRMYEISPKDPPPFLLDLADKAAQQFSLLNASRLITQTMKNIPFPVYKTKNDVADVRLLRTDGSFAYDLIYR